MCSSTDLQKACRVSLSKLGLMAEIWDSSWQLQLQSSVIVDGVVSKYSRRKDERRRSASMGELLIILFLVRCYRIPHRRPCPRHRYLSLLHLDRCVVVITFPRRKPRQHFGKARLSRVKQLCRMFRKAQQYITFQPRQSLTTTDPNTNQHSIYLLTFSLTRLSLGGGQSRNNGPGCTAATKQQFTMMMLWR